MPKVKLPSGDELAALPDWAALKNAYQHLRFDTDPAEAVEKFAVKHHKLNERLPNLETFWRFHIAPATNRTTNTHLRDGIKPVVSRMAERSYEIFCNVSDALDELAIVKNGLSPPRYRPCLNVLRFTGDALMLFDGLIDSIGRKTQNQYFKAGCVALEIGQDLNLFQDWSYGDHNWQKRRGIAVTHRNMLVHHGRPWLHFLNDDPKPDEVPFILRAEYSRDVDRDDDLAFLTWKRQINKFRVAEQRDKFVPLPEACEIAVDRTIGWLNNAYGRLVEKLDELLRKDFLTFAKYRNLWGLSAPEKKKGKG